MTANYGRVARWQRLIQVAICALPLLASAGESQVTVAHQNLQQEWLEIQANEDRQATKDWWRCLDLDRFNAFIQAGAEVNITDYRGWTPLHSASRYNPEPGVLIALLDAGAVIDARDRSGDTPLHWAAAENANVMIVTALLEAGADVNAVDKFGWLPIHAAAERNSNPEVIRALLEAGAKRHRRAYFLLFGPRFLLKHNSNMSAADKKTAMALLANPRQSATTPP